MTEKIREHGRPTMGEQARLASGVAHEAKYFAVTPGGSLVALEDRVAMPAEHRLAEQADLEKALAAADAVKASGGKVDEDGYQAVRNALLSLGWRPKVAEEPPPAHEHHEDTPHTA